MSDLTGVRYDVAEGVARITLARPDRSNAIDRPTAQSLREAVEMAAVDPDVRAVLLVGDGPRFCAGGDVAAMAAAPDRPAFLRGLATEVDAALVALDELDKPVVAQVQGAAAGAGLALVLAADVVVSARSSLYLAAYAGVGLTPDCGLSWLLPRAVGQQRALELLLTGRILGAVEARDWGLVTSVVDDEDVVSRGAAMARTLADGPAFALGQARRLVRSSWSVSRREAGADEARTIALAVDRPESRALVDAFAVPR